MHGCRQLARLGQQRTDFRSAAIIVSGLANTGPSRAVEPDAALLALTAGLHAFEAQAKSYDYEAPSNAQKSQGVIMGRYCDTSGQIPRLPALAAESMRAKVMLLLSSCNVLDTEADDCTRQHVKNLFRDLAGAAERWTG